MKQCCTGIGKKRLGQTQFFACFESDVLRCIAFWLWMLRASKDMKRLTGNVCLPGGKCPGSTEGNMLHKRGKGSE